MDLEYQDVEHLSFLSADYLSMENRMTSAMDNATDEGRIYTNNEPHTEWMPVSAISRSSEPVTEEVRVKHTQVFIQLLSSFISAVLA